MPFHACCASTLMIAKVREEENGVWFRSDIEGGSITGSTSIKCFGHWMWQHLEVLEMAILLLTHVEL